MMHPFRVHPDAQLEPQPWQQAREANPEKYAGILAAAEKLAAEPPQHCPATVYMEFVRNGNRINYEERYFSRRRALNIMICAEAMEGKGRFLEPMVDYVDAIMGEASWCVPAHLGHLEDPLPSCEDDEMVDLFAAETAARVADLLEVHGTALTAISPNLVRRIRKELVRRVVVPVEKHVQDFFWSPGINNWTPWICHNLLRTASLALGAPEEQERFHNFCMLLAECCERYYHKYGDDGCCDEGAMYWGASVQYFHLAMEFLEMAGAPEGFLHFHEEKYHRMCNYIAAAWFGGKLMLPFSDSYPRGMVLGRGVLLRMAKRINSKALTAFVRRYFPLFPDRVSVEGSRFGSTVMQCLYPDILAEADDTTEDVPPASLTIFPLTQQLMYHTADKSVALKGGHNGECHNHNDLGHFVARKDDKMVILDLGKVIYTRQVFDPKERYKIFSINAHSHNAPFFGGVGQEYGNEYAVSTFKCEETANGFTAHLDMLGAYPVAAGLKAYTRTFTYTDGVLRVKDKWELTEAKNATILLLSEEENSPRISCTVPLQCSTMPLDDPESRRFWGKEIYSYRAEMPPALTGEWEITVDLR